MTIQDNDGTEKFQIMWENGRGGAIDGDTYATREEAVASIPAFAKSLAENGGNEDGKFVIYHGTGFWNHGWQELSLPEEITA